jgi:hypothetical protein
MHHTNHDCFWYWVRSHCLIFQLLQKITIIFLVSTLQQFIFVFYIGLWVSIHFFGPSKKWKSYVEWTPYKNSYLIFILGYRSSSSFLDHPKKNWRSFLELAPYNNSYFFFYWVMSHRYRPKKWRSFFYNNPIENGHFGKNRLFISKFN